MKEKEIDSTIIENNSSDVVTQSTTSEHTGWLGSLSEKMSRQQMLATILGVVVIMIAGLGVWYWQKTHPVAVNPSGYGYQADPNWAPPVVTLPEGSYYIPQVIEGRDYSVFPKSNTTAQWKNPVKLDDLKLVTTIQENTEQILYYNLGTHGSNPIIAAQVPAMDPGGPSIFLFEQTKTGYKYMAMMSVQDVYRGPSDPYSTYFALTNLVSETDVKTVYQGLVGPSKISWSGVSLEAPYTNIRSLFDVYAESFKGENSTFSKVATISEGDLYVFQTKTGTDGTNVDPEEFYVKRFVLKLPSGLYSPYGVNYSFFSDDRIPDITWADGTKNKSIYRPDANLSGCGNPGSYIVPTKDISADLKIAGTTSTGVAIYEFKSIKDKTLLYFYHLQSGQYFNPATSQMEAISVDKWFLHHPVVALKTVSGEFTLMTNETYGLAAECGKPVVYLYPTQPTNVSVKVGADITVSEPDYGKGWNVLANPNGSLVNRDGKVYDSLFWEGLGHGDYPQITQGTIVTKDRVERVMTEQLQALGLNSKESQDFKDFWISRMPNTKYVRLTWFTTAQMDRLAPLYVNPKPDTVIRVFLDFQGMDEFKTIPAQNLTALPRQGFTLVEWGGLLRE